MRDDCRVDEPQRDCATQAFEAKLAAFLFSGRQEGLAMQLELAFLVVPFRTQRCTRNFEWRFVTDSLSIRGSARKPTCACDMVSIMAVRHWERLRRGLPQNPRIHDSHTNRYSFVPRVIMRRKPTKP